MAQINAAEPEHTSQQLNSPPNLISSVAQVFKYDVFFFPSPLGWRVLSTDTDTDTDIDTDTDTAGGEEGVEGGFYPEVRQWNQSTRSRT